MKRVLSVLLFVTLLLAGLSIANRVGASETQPVTIHAQGNAYHVDFMSILGKRADLRTSVAGHGLDVAFTQWLKVAHPDAYKSAAASVAANALQDSNGDPKSASSYCCEKSGACCGSGCSECCAKGPCKMGCCGMKQCKSLGNACCR